jgi:hypothetical protein
MSDKLSPLSPTVTAIFAEFLKKLEDEKTLSTEAIAALRDNFDQQKLDPESLRKAIFTTAGAAP